MAPPQVGNCLKPAEEEWREVFNRLSERFPTVPGTRVAQALRDHNGHAGEAAAVLRDLTSCTVKEADPDDVEHVSTLLSSPAMFKHACKEQFRKFDVNKDGVLEWEEVNRLTQCLYEEFGLQIPSEGSLKAFFHATDENMDGVLSEREFRKFFEMFLRYAFFDHLKLRQMVEKGQEIERKRETLTMGSIPVVAEVRKEDDAETASPQDSRASSASDGSKRKPTPDETSVPEAPAAQKSKSKPDAVHLAPIARRSPEMHSAKRENSEQDRSQRNSHREREHQKEKDRKGRQDKERGRGQADASEGPFGGAVRCLAQNGVAYRASPAFQDRKDAVVGRGETVQVLEHWVRTPDGWLPVLDSQGQSLFERSNADPDESTQHANIKPRSHQRQEEENVNHKKRVSIQERKDDSLDVNVRSASSRQKSPKPHEAASGGGGGGSDLKASEEEWRPVMERLVLRFPNITQDKIVQALRDNEGHAGKAASMLRYM